MRTYEIRNENGDVVATQTMADSFGPPLMAGHTATLTRIDGLAVPPSEAVSRDGGPLIVVTGPVPDEVTAEPAVTPEASTSTETVAKAPATETVLLVEPVGPSTGSAEPVQPTVESAGAEH